MGLIKMAMGAVRSELADQIREYIICDSLPNDVLMRKGTARNADNRAAHKYGATNNTGDNIISKGSVIAVNEGQFMLVVEDGKVVDFTDEPGEYIFDLSKEPSMLYGGFGKGLVESFKNVGRRFTFGGDSGRDQRVYFINKKLILDNKFGTPSPIPYRDPEFSLTVNMTCNGTYALKIVDPIIFYTNLCANVPTEYRITSEFLGQFKSDLLAGFRPALAKVSMMKIPFDMIAASEMEITKAMKETLYEEWEIKAGINVDRISIRNLSPVEDDNYKKLMHFQAGRVYTNAEMSAAMQAQARTGWMEGMGKGAEKGGTSADPMSGALGMMGMTMMGNMMNSNQMFGGMQQQPSKVSEPVNTGAEKWVCTCGSENSANFCPSCGAGRPKKFKCNQCGWLPEDPQNPPNFCPSCGNVFNDEDAI